MKEKKASVTVFFSLTCILFLCLICSVIESVRIQGAKAQTANILGMGNFSVFGEYENPLLEQYDIFGIDGSYGEGNFLIDKVEEKLKKYLLKNTDVKDRLLLNGTFDPWNLKLSDSSITKYTLLTDDRGEAFYQQAVSYMKVNSSALAVEAFADLFRDAEKVSAGEKNYEDMKQNNEDELARLEEQAAQQENREDSGSGTTDNSVENSEEQNSGLPSEGEAVPENPLNVIAAIRKSGLTGLVTSGDKLSEKKISGKSLPSKSKLKKGNMKIEKKYGGAGDDFLFREYLLKHFSDYSQKKTEGDLLYETEYLIAGKTSDRQNIDSVIKKLLMFREISNYTFCLGSKEHSAQAGALAAALTGILGLPAVVAAVKHALLIAWSFGEALLDVRILLEGGKVPILKSSSDWKLSLNNLINVQKYLKECNTDQKKGSDYQDYLRILLNTGNLSRQKMRALDLIQLNVRKEDGSRNFKVNHCITAIRSEAEWRCGMIFFDLPASVMNIRSRELRISQKGSISY